MAVAGRNSRVSDWGAGSLSDSPESTIYKIGIYGWRKRCLYCLILLMLVTVIINIALTIWILRVLDFNIHGMGLVRVTERGIRVEGDSEFVHPVHVRTIVSRPDESLRIASSKNITFRSYAPKNGTGNKLIIGDEVIEAVSKKFTVLNQHGKELFGVDDKEMVLGVDMLTVKGEGGATFDGSIQTAEIRSKPFEKLRLASSSQSVEIEGIEGVNMNAKAGGIEVNCRDNMLLESSKGKVILTTSNIFLPNLPQSNPVGPGRTHNDIFQVCLCHNGRLFLSPPRQPCAPTDDICED